MYIIIGFNGNSISTVEHILSACYGLELDNIYIDLDSNEVPVYDGSALNLDMLVKSGIQEQSNINSLLK